MDRLGPGIREEAKQGREREQMQPGHRTSIPPPPPHPATIPAVDVTAIFYQSMCVEREQLGDWREW